MSGLVPEAVVTDADVRAAQAVVDAWAEGRYSGREDAPFSTLTGASLLELRGLLAATLSGVRAAGYLEGLQVGRREAGQLVAECLRDEGLL